MSVPPPPESRSDRGGFVAIDFETADPWRDSACAVGLVRVRGGEIVERTHFLIRPPRKVFYFTRLHGIAWDHVKDQPTFGELWPRLSEKIRGVAFVAAHNAAFDRSVLEACCALARVPSPALLFECTVKLARQTWGLRPAALPDVCRFLDIPLRHHDALSDAEACARIVLAAGRRTADSRRG
jgi:DNA polymerase-3 subunit epsilon